MERNAISDFIDNLIVEKEVSRDDANELRETLELSAKDIEPARLANFVKSVQQRMDAPASGVFTGNRINIESVKVIAEKTALEVRREQVRFNENERIKNEKILQERENTLKEINKEIEKNNKEKERAEIEKKLKWISENNSSGSITLDLERAKRIFEVEEKHKKYNDALKNGASKEEVEATVIADRAAQDKDDQLLDDIATLDGVEMSAKIRVESGEATSLEEAYEQVLDQNIVGQVILGENITADKEIVLSPETAEYMQDYLEGIDTSGFDGKTDTFLGSTGKKGTIDRFIQGAKSANPRKYGDTDETHTIKYNGKEIVVKPDGLKLSQMVALVKLNLVERASKSFEAKAKALQAEIEELSKTTFDVEASELPQKMAELADYQRKSRRFGQWYYAEMRTYSPGIKNKYENTLKTDQEKRIKIINMYFRDGKSAVEIYQELIESGDIEPGSHLITQEVIDIISVEALTYLKPNEIADLVAREQAIEDLAARKSACKIIQNNLQGKFLRNDLRELVEGHITSYDRQIEAKKAER